MRKIMLVVEYNGTRYQGWQVQPNGITIQEVLEKTLRKITKKKTNVTGSGRTDSGVHAEGQVAHFTTVSRMQAREFLKALNSLLPRDIAVREAREVDMEFDARRSAVKKIYRYTILNRDYPSAFFYDQSWYLPFPLDVAAMKKAARFLIGRHDFAAFQGSAADVKTTVRDLFKLDIAQDECFIRLFFEGSGFLKYMVRNIVGTLVEVGKKRMPPERMRAILESGDRQQAGPTAQPQGLCLVKVFYE